MNLNLNFNGKTLLKNWWGIVLENLQTIKRDFEAHQSASSLDHPDKSVLQKHIADSAVGTAQIADYNVTTPKLGQYCITSSKIYPSAVLTPHIKNMQVTKEKLSEELQTQLDGFQEHIETPSQEIPEGSIEWKHMGISLRPFVRNYMFDKETYDYCGNDFYRAQSGALFMCFNSARGELIDAPPDTTQMEDGTVRYLLMVINATAMTRLQIAINLSSMKKYMRIVGSSQAVWREFA